MPVNRSTSKQIHVCIWIILCVSVYVYNAVSSCDKGSTGQQVQGLFPYVTILSTTTVPILRTIGRTPLTIPHEVSPYPLNGFVQADFPTVGTESRALHTYGPVLPAQAPCVPFP